VDGPRTGFPFWCCSEAKDRLVGLEGEDDHDCDDGRPDGHRQEQSRAHQPTLEATRRSRQRRGLL
jgi:hypothetical protein